MGIGAYLGSRTLLGDQAASQMTSAAQAQIAVLEEWTDEREQRLQLGSQRSALLDAVTDLLNAPTNSSRFRSAHDAALIELDDLRTRQGQILFSDLLITHTDGTILAATQPEWEGQITSLSMNCILTLSMMMLRSHHPPSPFSAIHPYEQAVVTTQRFSSV
jgi:hypothetical protein